MMALVVKNPSASIGDIRDVGLILESGRSPGGGHGNPLQYSCLENSMDKGAWWATVHEVAKSWTWRAIITHSAAEASPGNIVKGKGPIPNILNHNLWELEPVMCLNKVSRQFLLYHSLRYTDLKTPHSWLLASAYTPPELGNSLLPRQITSF